MATEGAGDWTEQAKQSYEDAVFAGDSTALERGDRELDAVEADLLLARGRLLHTRQQQSDADEHDGRTALELFERSAQLAEGLGDASRLAEALVWTGIAQQISGTDQDAAVASLERAAALAKESNAALTLSYALRHLGIAAHASGDLDGAQRHLTESTRLREQLGFRAGAAANLVGLAYVASAQDRGEEAKALLVRAERLARDSGADAVLATVHEAQRHL